MDVREKLVELLDDIQVRGEDFTDYEIYGMRLPDTVSNEDVASHLIAHGATVQEWISVKDRLPNWRDGKVLVFTKYGFSICERTVNYRWQGQHANWITHWAYLPEPPKGE